MNQNSFFQPFFQEVQSFHDKFKVWENQIGENSLYAQTMKEARECVNKVDSFLKTTKIYVRLQVNIRYCSKVQCYQQSLLSSGKSTFINSLLGQQLLPSKNEICTQKYITIKYGAKLIIDGEEFQNLEEANQRLIQLQSEDSYSVNINTPSLYHKEQASDLLERVIFVDTQINLLISPGFITGQMTVETLYSKPNFIDPKDIIIQLFLCDFTAFADQRDKILDKLQQEPRQTINENQQRIFNFFILNKTDNIHISENDNLHKIIELIKGKFQKDVFIGKISALNGLQYRISNSKDEMAEKEFFRKFFIDYKDKFGFENEEGAKYFSQNFIQKNKKLINNDNQDYLELLTRLSQEMKNQINCRVNQCKLYYYLLEFAFDKQKHMALQHANNDLRVMQPIQFDAMQQFIQHEAENSKNKIKEIVNKECKELKSFKNVLFGDGKQKIYHRLYINIMEQVEIFQRSVNQKIDQFLSQQFKNIDGNNLKSLQQRYCIPLIDQILTYKIFHQVQQRKRSQYYLKRDSISISLLFHRMNIRLLLAHS